MRVSLVPTHRRRSPIAASGNCPPLLDPNGAHAILGGHVDADGLAPPIAPRADTLFAPRGVCLERADGPLFVCDTGHHRLLIWTRMPAADRSPADLLIGQPDFRYEGRNANGAIGAATLNVPTGVTAANNILAVADAWNHRILLWHGYPRALNQCADVVLGQADFTAGLAPVPARESQLPPPATEWQHDHANSWFGPPQEDAIVARIRNVAPMDQQSPARKPSRPDP
jgi:hypothetical protein